MQIDPLSQLRDIHLPPPISWWPLAPGWWILIFAGIFAFIYITRTLIQRYRSNLYRRQALKKLSLIILNSQKRNTEKLALIMELLKQAVGSAYQGNHFNSQNNKDFVLFLKNSCSKPCFTEFSNDLQISLYSNQTDQRDNELLLETLVDDSKTWLKNHYPKRKLVRLGLC
jgi:hypothetical protein